MRWVQAEVRRLLRKSQEWSARCRSLMGWEEKEEGMEADPKGRKERRRAVGRLGAMLEEGILQVVEMEEEGQVGWGEGGGEGMREGGRKT